MGRKAIISGENQTMSTGSVMVAFQTAALGSAASNVRITRAEISQNATTTLAMCRAEFGTRNTSGTLTMTSNTPVVQPFGSAAFGLTGNTAPAGGVGRVGITSTADSGGTYANSIPFNFPNTAGYLFKPDPGEELWVPPSTLWIMRFIAAPGTLTGWTFTVWLEDMS